MNSLPPSAFRTMSLILVAVPLCLSSTACRNEASAAASSGSGGAASVAKDDHATSAAVPASAVGDPPADAAALIDSRCTRCHTAARIERNRGKDRAWWVEAMQSMVDKGARLSDAERAALLDYLTTSR